MLIYILNYIKEKGIILIGLHISCSLKYFSFMELGSNIQLMPLYSMFKSLPDNCSPFNVSSIATIGNGLLPCHTLYHN